MAQFKVNDSGIEIMGQNLLAPLAGMGTFRKMAEDILASAGLKDVIADDKHWYPLQNYLNAFKIIAEKTGDLTLISIGKKVMSSAALPPMNSIEMALGVMDIAYHMNYRNKKGEVLFNSQRTPAMLDGIGHYKYEAVPGENKAFMICSNPYPCAYDIGIITEFSQRYNKKATIKHDTLSGCRKNGSNECKYIVTW